jgi:hypothetical protein
MSLKTVVDDLLKEQKRSFSWLATEMGRTIDGLKLSLINETIKFSDLKKMQTILNVPIAVFFENTISTQKIKGNNNNLNQGSGSVTITAEGKSEIEYLKRMIEVLEKQLKDKDLIIELLKK